MSWTDPTRGMPEQYEPTPASRAHANGAELIDQVVMTPAPERNDRRARGGWPVHRRTCPPTVGAVPMRQDFFRAGEVILSSSSGPARLTRRHADRPARLWPASPTRSPTRRHRRPPWRPPQPHRRDAAGRCIATLKTRDLGITVPTAPSRGAGGARDPAAGGWTGGSSSTSCPCSAWAGFGHALPLLDLLGNEPRESRLTRLTGASLVVAALALATPAAGMALATVVLATMASGVAGRAVWSPALLFGTLAAGSPTPPGWTCPPTSCRCCSRGREAWRS